MERQIAVIGVPDEEAAHLRLLIRKAAEQLEFRWRWGSEDGADLVVVDPSTFAGQMARTRLLAGGVRCADFTDRDVPGTDLVLRRPLKLANVVDVLNRAAGGGVQRPAGIASHAPDFYYRDVGAEGDFAPDEPSPDERHGSAPVGAIAPGLEELLRDDAAERAEAREIKGALDDTTTVFGTAGPTARSEVRARDEPGIFSRPDDTPGPRRASVTDTARHSLRAYLDGNLLGGPSRITLPEAPPLVLDPKNRMFHSDGRLAVLEPYCRTALRRCDWEALTTAQLAELRKIEPPQPYLRLVWLYVLVHSEGQLARHLDPGGTYRLIRWIEIERDFSAYFRIASALLQPARLHEIAASSEASMADVFDVVNAYDAIGLIECKPRAPRAGLEPEPGKSKPGLLERLRRPFGRS